MREDTTSNTEADAAQYARDLGQHEDIGGDVERESDALLDEPDARLRPDPWSPFTCPRCGDDDRTGMPETCTCCGWRNYGGDAA